MGNDSRSIIVINLNIDNDPITTILGSIILAYMVYVNIPLCERCLVMQIYAGPQDLTYLSYWGFRVVYCLPMRQTHIIVYPPITSPQQYSRFDLACTPLSVHGRYNTIKPSLIGGGWLESSFQILIYVL